ncbi:MAG TPA: CAP domain-containing protein [Trueperaceae bacterium]
MTHPRSRTALTALTALLFGFAPWAHACRPAPEPLAAATAEAFATLAAAQAAIDPNDIDYALLTEAVFHETNERRLAHGRTALAHLRKLDKAACVHAEAMIEEDFFAHRNPRHPDRATPLDRVQNQGLHVGYVAENIAQVFALAYDPGTPVYPRRQNGRTVYSRKPGGQPLGTRSYLSLATALLDEWMHSPPHRKNILSEQPDYLGAGCQLGAKNELGMPMFDCVQVFFAPLRAR